MYKSASQILTKASGQAAMGPPLESILTQKNFVRGRGVLPLYSR